MGSFLSAIGYGTALFWVLVSMAVLIVTAIAATAIWIRRTNRRLRAPVPRILSAPATDTQQEEIGRILADTGFAYDWEHNIYYSVMNSWQRDMGYCSLFDDWSTPLGMVFDSEPVRFDYNGKRWLIEFWKGQYGITIGGEIGVYNTAEPDIVSGAYKGTYYRSAGDDETMDMAFTLSRDGVPLFERADRHWWLTGFVLGEYSDPSALTMEASVTLLDRGMRDAFLDALRALGYWDTEIQCSGNTVRFTFTEPRSKQPLLRHGPIYFLTMQRTKYFVAKYREMTGGLTNMYDILTELKARSPLLYHLAINVGGQKELLKLYEQIRGYLN